jgi:NAD(P)H dehydrogenase (quinone)
MSIEGDGHFAMVDKGDVARSLAAVLADPAFHANATYEISGPDLFTFRQIAELAQEVFDRPISINEVTAEERLAFWDSMGIPRTRESHDAIHQDAEWIASDELISGEIAIAQMGFQGIVTDHVWMLTRRQPRRFRSYLEEVAKTGIKRSIVQDMKEGQSR